MSDDVKTAGATRLHLLSGPGSGELTRAERRDVAGRPAGRRAQLPGRRRLALSGARGLLLGFVALVLAPTAVAATYFGWLASDIYVSEAKFAVRGAVEHLPRSAALDMFTPLTALNSSQDAFVVASYLGSAPLIEKMDGDGAVRRIFSRPEADVWARLKEDATAEELRKYWQSMVKPTIDNLSGVVTLQVMAYKPEDALQLSSALLVESEKLVNAISERKNQDSVRYALDEVSRAERRVQNARLNLQAFRNESGVVDPVKSAEATMKLGMSLRTARAELEAELATVTRSLADTAPSVQVLKARLGALNVEIGKNDRELTGSGSAQGRSASAVLYRFESLELERQFAEKLYTLSQSLYERARINAERQNLYLVTFVPPALAELPLFPRRIPNVVIVFVCAFALWAILSLVVAAVRDHQT